MTDVSTEQKLVNFKSNIRGETGKIVLDKDYGTAHSRFTNMEAGLKMAHDMLNGTKNKNKFIVFLTDGLPTTYVKSEYDGYDPYMDGTNIYGPVYGRDNNKRGQDGYFADMTMNDVDGYESKSSSWCLYGTSYSDKAAQKASVVASVVKDEGITVYSVGVSLKFEIKFQKGTDFEKYNAMYNPYDYVKTFITVDKNRAFFVIDRANTELDQLEVFKVNQAFEGKEGWLGQVIATPGYYYSADNIEQMNSAFDNIFKDLAAKTNAYSTDAWLVTDPIPVGAELGYVEYVAPLPVEKIVENGEYIENQYITNEYEYLDDTKTINWDLLRSENWYTTTDVTGGTTITKYVYKLKYRVRLTNEYDKFEENKIYETNGTTTLKYQVIETENDKTTMSEVREVDFPIPSVHGYLGELSFTKVCEGTTYGIPGATFTLTHDPTCDLCTLTEENPDYWSCLTKTAISGENGNVSFTGIPSGHTYILKETQAPAHYIPSGEEYTVKVAYDDVTVKKTGENGEVTWIEPMTTISNSPKPELPATGGVGVKRYVGVGVVLMTTSVLWYAVRRKQRE